MALGTTSAGTGALNRLVRRYGVQRLYLSWTSHASAGTVTITGIPLYGKIVNVQTKPGSVTPSSYSMTLKGESGLDEMGGKGATRSTTVAEEFCPTVGDGVFGFQRELAGDSYTLAITGAGNSKTGELWLTLSTSVES